MLIYIFQKFFQENMCSLCLFEYTFNLTYGSIKSTMKNENQNQNYTMLIPKEYSYCCRKSTARGPRFKVSSKGLSAEIDILQRSPIQVHTKADVA